MDIMEKYILCFSLHNIYYRTYLMKIPILLNLLVNIVAYELYYNFNYFVIKITTPLLLYFIKEEFDMKKSFKIFNCFINH